MDMLYNSSPRSLPTQELSYDSRWSRKPIRKSYLWASMK